MKKKFMLLMLSICITNFIYSQTNSITILDSSKMTAQRWRDTCFALLNLSASQIPSGYLLDYSLAAFNDSNFNSLISTKTDTISDVGDFFSLHNILTSAVVNSSAASIGNTDSLFINAYRYKRNTGNIPLLFLYQPYQKIRKTALSQGLFTLTPDSLRLKDVTGRPSSPYDNEYCFAFSPFQNQLDVFGNISFSLPSQFWLMSGVSSVQVDFGDGAGYRTLSQNSTVSIYYPASGTYYLNAKITTGAATFIAKSSLQYTMPKFYIKPDSVWNISVAPVDTSIGEYISAGNQSIAKPQGVQPLGSSDPCSEGSLYDMENCDINPGAQVEIVYGCDHIFDKPIIVVEGFDPIGKTTVQTLQTNVENTQSTTGQDFYTTMRGLGYDFVFVIFTKNTTSIINNAMVLEQVIERVNSSKQGNNKSTVIGFSMGGLIAQYALRDMENKGINHQVANYFSYDSPHQGANVPLGLQWLFNEMLTDMPYLKYNSSVGKLYNSYTSIAAQQMLATYATGTSGVPTNSVRSGFAQELINMGYPQTTLNYGISQGRGNNTSGTTNAGVGTQFGFTNGSTIFSGNLGLGIASMYATVNAVSTTSNSSILNYYFLGNKVATLFGIPIGIQPVIRIQNIKYQSAYPYDDAPGGYENTQAQFDYNFNHLWILASGSDHGHYGHCYVPLASALDLQNQGYGSSDYYQSNNMYYTLDNNIQSPGQLTGNTLNPTTLSPFKSVLTYTSDCSAETCESYCGEDGYRSLNNIQPFETTNWNEWHEGDFSNQVQLFVQRKILGTNTFQPCSGSSDLCGITPQITGPTYFCNTATFNLSKTLQGVTYQWSFPNGTLQITGGQGTPTINVSEVYSGPEVVTCEIINSCGIGSTYTFNTTVGNVLTGTINQGGILTSMNTVNSVSAGATLVTFQWPGVTGISCHQSSTNPPVSQTGFIYYPSNSEFWFTLSSGQSITVSFSGTGCGGTTIATRSFTVGGGGNPYVISPNPASSSINITSNSPSSNSKTENAQTGTTIQVSIMDVNGSLKKQQQFSSSTANMQLNVADLASGTYFVQIINGNTIETQKLIINR